MASSKNQITLTFFILFLLSQSNFGLSCFKSIISFGDSLADTGNLLSLSRSASITPHFALPPYGETFFHQPTGRFSDGRIVIDFFAEELGLPLVRPFHGGQNLSSSGVNFAVAGATALPDSFFAGKGVKIPHQNVSLTAQMSWFKEKFLPNVCRNPADCKKYIGNSLVLMGEIGGNDYNHAFFQGKSADVIRTFVPEVVKTIGTSINEMIKLGAVTMMVPGNLPIGCSAYYLTYFKNSNKKDYDPKTGCLDWLNRFSQYHNKLLQSELHRIRLQNPNVIISYADYYNAVLQLYRSPHKFGFDKGGLKACCGSGGPYNVNMTLDCGFEGAEACADPSSYVNWDGIHLTEAACRWIANGLLAGSFTSPHLTNSVSAVPSNIDAGSGFPIISQRTRFTESLLWSRTL